MKITRKGSKELTSIMNRTNEAKWTNMRNRRRREEKKIYSER
jgi:hypothetical protein